MAQEPSILDRLAKPSSSFLKRLCMGMCSPNRSAAFGSLVNESTYCRMCSFLEALATPFYSRKLLFVCFELKHYEVGLKDVCHYPTSESTIDNTRNILKNTQKVESESSFER